MNKKQTNVEDAPMVVEKKGQWARRMSRREDESWERKVTD